MNLLLGGAASLAAIGVFWHGVGGEVGIVRRLDPETLAPSFFGDGDITKRFLRACWHLFTVVLVASSAVLFWLAQAPPGPATIAVSRLVAAEFAGFLVVYLVVAVGRPVLFVRAPQWLFFSAVAALAWMGGAG